MAFLRWRFLWHFCLPPKHSVAHVFLISCHLQRKQFRSGSGKATTAVRKSEEKRGKRQAARRAEELGVGKQENRMRATPNFCFWLFRLSVCSPAFPLFRGRWGKTVSCCVLCVTFSRFFGFSLFVFHFFFYFSPSTIPSILFVSFAMFAFELCWAGFSSSRLRFCSVFIPWPARLTSLISKLTYFRSPCCLLAQLRQAANKMASH